MNHIVIKVIKAISPRQLKTLLTHNNTMTSIVQDIQVVRSLRKDLRDLTLPNNILNSIDTIHNCIKSGTDLNGWKKVDWRNSATVRNSGPVQQRSGPSSGYSRGGGSSGNGFFNGRQSNYGNDRYEQSSSPSHHAFGGRSKGNFNRQPAEQPQSIPLTGSTAVSNTPQSQSPQNTIVTPQVNTDGFRPVPQKYVSKFKKSAEKVEDTILNTIILGKLNKFSEQNYPEIKEFITHIIDSGQTDMIKCFMKLVFEKAASEEMFCPLYAKLLSELSARYPVLLTEMANLYSEYMEIFEEVVESSAENYNEICKRNVEKKYRRGYSQFLAELIKHAVVDTETFMKIVTKIITQVENNMLKKEASKVNEEYADCLMKIMKAIQKDDTSVVYDTESDSDDEDSQNKIEDIRQTLKGDVSARIKPLTARNPENIGLSNKARFTFLDIFEGIQKF